MYKKIFIKFIYFMMKVFKSWGFITLLLMTQFFSLFSAYGQEYASEILNDGVVRYYNPDTDNGRSRIYSFFEKLFNNFAGDMAPFGKSVAFLAGVSNYENIGTQLKWVKNDLQDMRDFLLTDGGFDEVYVAKEKIVNADLLNNYMRNYFPRTLNKTDRLLFYYAGHGDDNRGKKGYLQFSGARNKNFVGNQVLSLDSVVGWCDELPIKHLLIMLDSCASGLARRGDGAVEIVNRLSKHSSRIIMTAGTGEQDTFEVENNNNTESGNGVFTRAFLDILGNQSRGIGVNGFLTIDEIYSQMKNIIAAYARDLKVELDPDLIHYKKLTNPGTFVFVNPNVDLKNIQTSVRDFDTFKSERRGAPELVKRPKPRIKFRSVPTQISKTEIGDLFKKNDFFSMSLSTQVITGPDRAQGSMSDGNRLGNGIMHDYQILLDSLVVYDTITGLMWKAGKMKKVENSREAESYIRRLNHKELYGGFDDWRLPTLEEAMSLMESEENADGIYVEPILANLVIPRVSKGSNYYIITADKEKFHPSYTWFVSYVSANIYSKNIEANQVEPIIKVGVIAVRSGK